MTDKMKQVLVLFPDGKLFPVNPEHIFEMARGLSFKRIRNDLLSSNILYSSGKITKIVDVQKVDSTSQNPIETVRRKFLRECHFKIKQVDISQNIQKTLNSFIEAAQNSINSNNIEIRQNSNELDSVTSGKALYDCFDLPNLVDCLDTL